MNKCLCIYKEYLYSMDKFTSVKNCYYCYIFNIGVLFFSFEINGIDQSEKF